jgi:transcriptional regulator with XRE-family HTH domain
MTLRLREWRTKRRLSLRQLAELAGVSFVTVFRIEAGKLSPTVAMLERLAEALDIGIRDLFPIERPARNRRRRK